ncbi:MAG: family 43 glycosylhydrolase [Paludibacteraceae bacterium]|nr:family 43 glycosylhydrolase [Paludibacteraceae bacterium]
MKSSFIRISISLLSFVVIAVSCSEKPEDILIWNDPPTTADTLYQNPVFQPDLADPTVVRAADGAFYAYGTENNWSAGIHRMVPILKSKDLVNWEYVTDAFVARPSWKNEGGIWAPDVTFVNSKYYMYYSISTWGDSNPGIGLAISDLPYGPFVDQGKVFDSKSIGVNNSIDPYFIQTGTGRNKKSYLFWGSFQGIYGIELSADLKTPVGNKFKIANSNFEATYILEREGKFYFFGSLGSCCEGADSRYRLGVAVATSITGPYLDKEGNSINEVGREGTLFLSGDREWGWVGPGHNAEIVTDDNGNDFILYHAIDVRNPYLAGGATRRPLMIDKISWVDGWPKIKDGLPSKTLQAAPYFERN